MAGQVRVFDARMNGSCLTHSKGTHIVERSDVVDSRVLFYLFIISLQCNLMCSTVQYTTVVDGYR